MKWFVRIVAAGVIASSLFIGGLFVVDFLNPMMMGEAEELATRIFVSESDRHGFRPEAFDGPYLRYKDPDQDIFFSYWKLRLLNNDYPPLLLDATAGDAYADGMTIPEESRRFFRLECQRVRIAGGSLEALPFFGQCEFLKHWDQ